MKNIFTALLLLIALLPSATITAQTTSKKKVGTLSGTIVSEGEKEPLPNAAIQLFTLPDTVFKAGNASDLEGKFTISVEAGEYLMRITYVGFLSQESKVKIAAKKTNNIGEVLLKPDVVALKEATVTAEVPPVTMSEDTMVYNSAAFRVPASSMLEELLKKYPGVEVEEDGTIKVNGKTVNRILMKGKDFFGTDKNMALKNIPAEVVDRVKFYDKDSDFKRVTGIDDGEEETVLDLQMKRGADQGWFGNTDVAYGSHDRYSAKNTTSYFTDKAQMSLILSANNIGDRGFRGGGGSGLMASKMGGFNFATLSDKVETGGNLRFNHRDTDARSYTSTENFMTAGNANQFSTSNNTSLSRSSDINADFRLEWKPDSLTNIILRPSMSYSTSDSWSKSASATFDADPFKQGEEYRMDMFGTVPTGYDSIAINRNLNESMSSSESRSVNANLQINRRLGKVGRNLTFGGSFRYSDSESENISNNDVKYYRQGAGNGYVRKRYSTTPNTNWSYSAQTSYTEPLSKIANLQLSYRFNYSYSNSDRATYVFDNLDYNSLLSSNYHFPLLPEDYEQYKDNDLSRYSTYRNMNHDVTAMVRFVTEKMNLSVGASWLPQQSRMKYQYMGVDTVLKRTVNNFTPNVRMRYKWSRNTTLNLNYRGRTSQPSMTDLLDITDDSNPLNITQGNPGLKPSFTNNLNAFFNTYNPEAQRGMFANLRFSNTLNSISNKVTYNEETGGRTTRPENINGNWNAGGGFTFNSAIPANTKFTYSTTTDASFNHGVAYISMNNQNSVRNTVKTTSINERLRGGYRNDWFEITLNGSLRYDNSKNEQRPNQNLETFNFSYGPSTNILLPWQNIRLYSDIYMSSRRGYSDPSFNTNELLWNAQISASFLKSNALTVSFQVFDILHEQSNVSRNISAIMRSDTQNNAIHSYCMLHIIYKFNQMGNKEMRNGMRGFPGGEFPGGMPSRGGAGGFGRGGGGFGGGGFGGGGFGGGGRF
ncbi:MAG: TonB-dependent receptor [Bacteroidaceae bacterium]|nr:TonB-dependent receptor [Bacteroidaceae bacterium]